MAGAIVAIGEPARIAGWALAGVRELPADDAEQARQLWAALDTDVALVILTPRAAADLAGEPASPGRLTVVSAS
ncbi:hypothetical protein [Pseudonocardia acidicola]|nr:hypothetical protein [Pseudonocardia acidicola]